METPRNLPYVLIASMLAGCGAQSRAPAPVQSERAPQSATGGSRGTRSAPRDSGLRPGPLSLRALATYARLEKARTVASASCVIGAPIPPDDTRWELRGDDPSEYTIQAVGERATIGALTGSPAGFGTVMQWIDATPYLGQRIQFLADVTAQVSDGGWAGLWMRIDGPNGELLGFDNMSDRPIRGTGASLPSVVLDVPDNAADIAFGLLLDGGGRVSMDDPNLQVVCDSVPTTNMVPPPPSCPGMPIIPVAANWGSGGLDAQDYVANLTQDTQSLAAAVPQPVGFDSIGQQIDAAPFRGARLQFSATIDPHVTSGSAGLWMRVDGPNNQVEAFDNMADRPIVGNASVTPSIVVDVPMDAVDITFGMLLDQSCGSASMHDASLQVVCTTVPTTDLIHPSHPTGWLIGWTGPATREAQYDLTVTGDPSAGGTLDLGSSIAHQDILGEAARWFPAGPYLAKRVRFSADVSLHGVSNWAGLTMEIDGQDGTISGFDDMSDRPLTGMTTTSAAVVLDVPQATATIKFGIDLHGPGDVVLSNVRFETVDTTVATTGH